MSHFPLIHPSIKKIKEKKKKRNINNDLAVLPGYNIEVSNLGSRLCLGLIKYYNLVKQLSYYLYFFSFGLTTQE